MANPKDIIAWQEQYKNITQKTVCNLYDSHADIYDKIVGSFQDDGHGMTMSTINDLIPNKSSRILDFAAGTGLFGQQLHNNGYTNIDAFDGSQLCIDQCKERNIYTHFMVEFVGVAELNIEKDSYDALVCYGGFAHHHLPISVFSEWIRCVKPGGYIINSFRWKWLTDEPMYNEGKLEGEIKRLENEKKWKFISKETTNEQDPETTVVKYVLQVC